MAKDAGFKVVAHMMPDLPNVGWERDVEQFIVSRHGEEGETNLYSLIFPPGMHSYTHFVLLQCIEIILLILKIRSIQ